MVEFDSVYYLGLQSLYGPDPLPEENAAPQPGTQQIDPLAGSLR